MILRILLTTTTWQEMIVDIADIYRQFVVPMTLCMSTAYHQRKCLTIQRHDADFIRERERKRGQWTAH